jgi:hypothetical protein
MPMLTKIFWVTWTIVLLLLIGTLTTPIEITNGLFEKGLVYIFVFGIIKILTANLSWNLARKLALSALIFGALLIFKQFTDWRGDWKTQTILFQNKHLFNQTIEFQLQDKGALGFNKRTIDRRKIFPFISWTKRLTDEDLKNIDLLTWDKVDIELNEQKFKGG